MSLVITDISTHTTDQNFQLIESTSEPVTNSYYIELMQEKPPIFKVTLIVVKENLKPVCKLTITVGMEPKKPTNYDKEDRLVFLKCAVMCALMALYKIVNGDQPNLDLAAFLTIPSDDELNQSLNNKNYLN